MTITPPKITMITFSLHKTRSTAEASQALKLKPYSERAARLKQDL